MSDQPLFGEWYIRVEALGQVEESQFLVEEYYQTRYEYQMSDQPLFGEWYIRVEALGQVEESQFLVEEYYQTRYEVCFLTATTSAQ
ncbi:hypothetical protein PYW07_006060 [Mythimna separata]|uniref:Uncharacterized protein n=1 Tax=Mythimna separata TaxID=271217 RepID=A0AAD7YKR8_MYTSE|nr:hypothetical protein PYW07_006060 [Mythimna separata]